MGAKNSPDKTGQAEKVKSESFISVGHRGEGLVLADLNRLGFRVR